MKITAELDVKMPTVPNFLTVDGIADGIPIQNFTSAQLPIQNFTSAQLQSIGEEWTRQLIERAALRRKTVMPL